MIYTLATIEVSRVFKGKINKSTPTHVHILTVGGEVDSTLISSINGLKLVKDYTGIFLLNLTKRENLPDLGINSIYETTADMQGFIWYYFDDDFGKVIARDVFWKYPLMYYKVYFSTTHNCLSRQTIKK